MDAGWRDVAQGLVWAQLIVFFPESVKLSLLDGESICWGLSRFCLEFPVHALVPAILFGVPRIRVYGFDAELKEPDREKGKPGDGVDVAERWSIVRVHLQGEAVFVEYALENGPGMGIVGKLKAFC